MSQNLRLVEYFSSNFYLNHTINLAHIASPSFVFRVNGGDKLDFKAFSLRRKLLSQNGKLSIGDISSDDDTTFYADFVAIINSGEEATGNCTFRVKNDLIERVEINYHLSKVDLKRVENELLFDNESSEEDNDLV